MKNKIMSLLVLAAGCLAWSSCTEDEMESDKGNEALKLSVSTSQLALDQRLDDKEALQLTWTAGSNQGTNAAISYQLEIDVQGNGFADGIKKEIGRTDSRIVSFTHKELNDLLLSTWNLPVEEEAAFEARVTATVSVEAVPAQVSDVVTFKLTPYKYRVLNLWMVGDATPNGWTKEKATPMNSVVNVKGGFVWEGMLQKGEFKLLTTLADWTPAYNRDETQENKLVYRDHYDENNLDTKFVIGKTGNYRVTLSVETLNITIEDLGGDVPSVIYEHVWMMGDAAPGGWSWDDVIAKSEMTQNTDNKNQFTYEGPLKAGEIKFPVEIDRSFNGKFIVAMKAEASITADTDFQIVAGADNKWKIETAGSYKILIDLSEKKIYFTKK